MARDRLDILTALKRPDKLDKRLKKNLTLTSRSTEEEEGEEVEEGEALVGEEEAEQEDPLLLHRQEEPPPPLLQEPGSPGQLPSNSDLSVTSVISHSKIKINVMTI